ncbi:hypothetical protein KVD24_07365 [Helicobacter pylori]|nr:hypothetical protein KVD24_07365 [Helicobacter pylori]
MMRLNAFNHDQIKPTHPNHQQEIKNKKQNKQEIKDKIKIRLYYQTPLNPLKNNEPTKR